MFGMHTFWDTNITFNIYSFPKNADAEIFKETLEEEKLKVNRNHITFYTKCE